jgi:hypothetical protein
VASVGFVRTVPAILEANARSVKLAAGVDHRRGGFVDWLCHASQKTAATGKDACAELDQGFLPHLR